MLLHLRCIQDLEESHNVTTPFHLEKLKHPPCAHEYSVNILNPFNVLGTLEGPVELWNTFKGEALAAAKECILEHLR